LSTGAICAEETTTLLSSAAQYRQQAAVSANRHRCRCCG